MAYIPNDAQWYLAEIVEEIKVEDDPRNVLHVNLNLVRADSPEAAYERALKLGRDGDATYENPAGKTVSIKFRGLKSLNVIHDNLEHGAELIYSERIDVPEHEIVDLLRPKEKLGVFGPIEPSCGPSYISGDIWESMPFNKPSVGTKG